MNYKDILVWGIIIIILLVMMLTMIFMTSHMLLVCKEQIDQKHYCQYVEDEILKLKKIKEGCVNEEEG